MYVHIYTQTYVRMIAYTPSNQLSGVQNHPASLRKGHLLLPPDCLIF